ncbi:MAG: amino acid aminotransferase [Burkholderiales bacterium]
MFKHVDPYAGDPIFKLNDEFQQDPRAGKINLTIGYYFDDAGRVPMMRAVREAEQGLFSAIGPRPYLPMAGDTDYRSAVQGLLFGADHPALGQGRVATIQTLGGSGGLKVGADFIRRFFPGAEVWVSDPSWDNHRAIFEGAGFKVHAYPYYDPATGGLRFDAMLQTLRGLPEHSVVLLHACCHNPTGVDLSAAQWAQLMPVLAERRLLPFIDMAYQGFGTGLEEDALAVRLLADRGLPGLVANSFSKNFSLYGERCGALSVLCPTAAEAGQVAGQLQLTVRMNYSSPPVHGARIITRVLNTPSLRAAWRDELAQMCERMHAMRTQLHEAMSQRLPGRDLRYFLTQQGMFSYTGLLPAQVDRLREQHAVYLLRSGRLCIAGLNTGNVQATATAMAQVMQG